MLSGELYLACDPELTELRRLARVRLQRYNANLTLAHADL
ncbi:MAG: maltose acetyltransferase domain-containing protein [Thermoanaerobaculia bacterium]